MCGWGKNLNDHVGSLIQDQTRDYDDNPAPCSETVHAQNSSGDDSNHQCDWHKGKDFKVQARSCSDQAGLPNLIIYKVATETVTILAVFHGARDLVRALAERRNEASRS